MIYFLEPFLPPANEVCEGYVFTGVCLSTGGGSRSLIREVSIPGWGSLSRGGGSWSLSRGVSIPGASVQGDISVQGVSGGSLSRRVLSQGVSVQGRGTLSGRSLSRGSLSRRGGLCHGEIPPYGNERAVRILL